MDIQFWIPHKKLSKSKRNKLLKIYQRIIEQRKKLYRLNTLVHASIKKKQREKNVEYA